MPSSHPLDAPALDSQVPTTRRSHLDNPRFRRVARAATAAPPAGVGTAVPWWRASLDELETREAEARRRLLEARAELQAARLEADRATARVGARDRALEEAAQREAALRDEVDAARAALRVEVERAAAERERSASLALSLRTLQDQVGTLTVERDAANGRVRKVGARFAAQSRKLEQRSEELVQAKQEAKALRQELRVVRSRAAKYQALTESRSFRFVRFTWRVRAALKRPFVRLAARIRG